MATPEEVERRPAFLTRSPSCIRLPHALLGPRAKAWLRHQVEHSVDCTSQPVIDAAVHGGPQRSELLGDAGCVGTHGVTACSANKACELFTVQERGIEPDVRTGRNLWRQDKVSGASWRRKYVHNKALPSVLAAETPSRIGGRTPAAPPAAHHPRDTWWSSTCLLDAPPHRLAGSATAAAPQTGE